jgi:3-(3-hydroxy-phenyl)propionate hydroxylase
VKRAGALDGVELRWENKVVGVRAQDDLRRVPLRHPDGDIGSNATGSSSPTDRRARSAHMLGPRMARSGVSRPLPDRRHSHEVEFPDGALVLVRSAVSSRTSRRCCIGRPTTSGASISARWGRRSRCGKQPERIVPRLRAMLGEDADFEIEWASVYTFQCRPDAAASGMAACSLRRRGARRCRRSARVGRTAGSRTSTISSGSTHS